MDVIFSTYRLRPARMIGTHRGEYSTKI